MRRICLAALLAAGLLAGCSRKVSVTVEPPDGSADATAEEKKTPVVALPVGDDPHKIVDSLVASLAEPTKQERYDALLLDAFSLLADRKYAEALNSLQTAQSVQDTEQVRLEIDKVKAVIAQQTAAERTARDIQAVLNEGKADEAAKLGTQALQQFGGTDLADDLGKLKREADALAAAPVDDRAARQARFRDEAAAALRDQNLRAAAIACEQALQAGDDPELRRQYDEVRAALARYDDSRARAARLRRDPSALEDALDALKQAQQAWDTPQVRMEIDECNFALQRRRDRLGVADFEVRGDVGLPDAGRVVADELLAGFKPRFDLVERSQLGKVLDELKLEGPGAADDPLARQEVGRLANLRYLVVGSLSPLNGVTAQARLVEARTGLVAQTGRVSAPTVQELIPRLRVLAQMLMMDDDQKMAFEADLARRAAVNVQPVNIAQPLPPPPPAVVQGPPPPPIIMFAPQPPPLGGLVIADFRLVPVAPPPVTEVVVVRDDPRRRLLALSLELGDNLFRRGRHRDADRQFQLALTLADNRADIQLRIDRNRPFLPPPPPPPVVVAPQPPVVVVPDPLGFPPAPVVVLPPPPPVRPRIIVFNFLVNSPPGLVPPAVGDWAADQFAAQFMPLFEVVDRGEVSWYMGRLGITMRDVLTDALARRTLAQALNVRFIVFGAIEHTASFNVTSQMIDAETGAGAGTGMIHVQDHQEMKLRMHELAKQLGAPSKDEQARLEQQGKEREKALNEARGLLKAGQYARSAEVSKAALKQYPDNVALQTVLHDAEDQARKAALEEARKQEAARRDAELKAAIDKQSQLAKQADLARLKAEQAAKAKDDAARGAEEARKQRAAEQLRSDGNKALQQGNYALAIQSLQSAASLKPSDDLFRELGKAKALADEAARKKSADEQARLAAERKKQEDDARQRVEEEKKKREADELARRKAQEQRDKQEAERFLAQAKDLLGKQQFDAALAAAESAHRLHAADADKLLHDIQEQKTLTEAKKKGEEARLDAEKKLAEEKARRDKADAEAKKNQEAYVAALKDAQKAVTEKRYDQAIAKFDEAGKLFRTDAVLSGRKQAEELRDREKAQADAEKRKKEAEDKRTARIKALQGEGQKALDAQQFDAAIKAYREAVQLAPGNADLQAALSKAEHARDDFNAKNRAKVEAAAAADATAKKKRDDFALLVQKGRDALAAKKYDDAVQALAAANQLLPDDPTGKDLLRQAEKARTDSRAATDSKRDQDQRTEKVRQLVATARKALDAKDYPGAEKALAEAGKLAPDDKDVVKANQDLVAARKAAAASDKELKQRKDDYNLAMGAGKDAMQKKNYQAAVNSYKEALRLMPGDKDAADLLKAAEKGLADAKTAADAEKKKQADFDAALRSGSAALAAKKYDDAIRAYTEALKLKPGDKDATAGLNNAKQAQDADKKKQKTAADYDNAIRAGKAALAAKKYDDAIKAFTEAGQLQPGDRDAAALLKDAQNAKAAGDAEAKRKADEAKKQDEFARLMAAGQAAAGAKKYDDAIKAYTDALKLMPGDREATKGLNDAKQAADAAKAPPKPDPSKTDPKAEYAKQMQAGAAADKAGKYADAMAAYREALKQVPNDAKATQALKNAEFNSHMAAGKKLHADKKYNEAAKEYEEALKIILDEPRAKDALKRAKDGKPLP
jgi:tetratricopeptide (TPR) repeat protein